VLDSAWQDLRYTVRSLGRTPAFAVAVILTLALGIGANTAIFSLIEAVMLRTLPVNAPGDLYFVAHGAGDRLDKWSNYRWLEQVQQRSDMFAGVTAYTHRDFKVSSGGGIERVPGQYVSGNYHAVLGVPMVLGRGFTSENDRVAGASPYAVISDAYWSRRFDRSPSAIGTTLVVGGHPVTIVGVTAPAFVGVAPGDAVDLTLPLSMRVLDEPDFLTWTDSMIGMPIIVRLQRGVSARVATDAIASTFGRFMAEPFNVDFRKTRSGQTRAAVLWPAARGDDDLRNEYSQALRVLMGMVALVLFIACVNVANLLVVRSVARSRDLALRLSIGARRSDLLRQFSIEGLVIAVAGGAAGVALATWATRLIADLLRGAANPVFVDVRVDTTVLLFTALTTLLCGAAFGIAPAFASRRVDLTPALKGASALPPRGRWRGRQMLVAAQIALSIVVVFGACLLVRSLQNLRAVEGGFHKAGLVLFNLDARDTGFAAERLAALCADVIARLDDRPDVGSGSCSTMSPVQTRAERRLVTVPAMTGERPPDPVYANSVDAGYFDTYGMRVVRGRGILPSDSTGSTRVAVVTEAVARQYFGAADPVGQIFRWGRRDPGPPVVIVGVVSDARLALRDEPPLMIYTPLDQRDEPAPELLAAIRIAGAAPSIGAAIRESVQASSRQVGVAYVRTMDEQIDAALVAEWLLALLSAAFAILALVLACVGLYGVISYDVGRRTRDIGVRLALGAQQRAILASVLGNCARIAVAGMVVGLAGALFVATGVSRFLFGLEPRDPGTVGLSAAILALTALAAGYVPARRAARVDPVIALRAE
jgi:predicted permease